MTSWFRIAFTWRLGHFILRLYEGTIHVDNIKCNLKSQTLRMRYQFQSTGRPISHRNEWSFRVYNTVAKFCTVVKFFHTFWLDWELATWYCTSTLWSISSCQFRVSADQYQMTVLQTIEVKCFFEVSCWQVTCYLLWLSLYINHYSRLALSRNEK